jgi:hypothetical protein
MSTKSILHSMNFNTRVEYAKACPIDISVDRCQVVDVEIDRCTARTVVA